MKRNYKIIASLIAAMTLAGAAVAQPGKGCDSMGGMAMGPGQGQMGRQGGMKFDPAQRAERHLQSLKTDLKLTPEQEPVWLAFAEKAKENAGKGMHGMRDQMTDQKLTAPERMAKMETLMSERLTTMKGVHESFNRLYAALTPEQKAVADQHHAKMGQGMGPKQGQGKGQEKGQGMGPGKGPARTAPPQS